MPLLILTDYCEQALQQWDLLLAINISLNWCEWKNYVEKYRTVDVFDRRWSLDDKDTDQNISARSLTVLIFALECAVCDQPQPEHESVPFSAKCFNPLKLYPLSGNIFWKRFASYF